MDRVEGYTWTRPGWMGRDAAPVIAVVETSDHLGSRQIRIVTLSGDKAQGAMHKLGLRQLTELNGASDLLEYVIEMPCDQGFFVIMYRRKSHKMR